MAATLEYLTKNAQHKKPLYEFYAGIEKVPTVINKNLILDCFYVTCDREIKKTRKKEDIEYEEIQSLNLDSQEILKLDHLWMLANLKVLSLAHNNIEKIENINELFNLVELNLSFNKIEIIEGLEGMKKMEVLSLFSNKIQVLQGLDDQTNSLKMLSIGDNDIKDLSCIPYLSNFSKLISLNMSNNPCASTDRFKESLAAFLPSLIYYDYEFITDTDRKLGEELNKEELNALRDLQRKEEEELKKKKAAEDRKNFLENAYIDGLEGVDFYEKMFEKDPDGQSFRDSTDLFNEIYDRLEKVTLDVSSKIFEAGEKNYSLRIDEVQVFRQNSEENTEGAARRLDQAIHEVSARLNRFVETSRSYFKGPMTKQLRKDEKSLKLWLQGLKVLKQYADKYLEDQWLYLMRVEMKSYEMNEETISIYDRNLSEIINVFVEETQSQFTRLRDAENDCFEELSNKLFKLLTEICRKSAQFDQLPIELKALMSDRDTLSNALEASHDQHSLAIDSKEDSIISRLKAWHKQQTGELVMNEFKRNRNVLIQIDKYIKNLKKEFELQICGIMNLFRFLEPNEKLEEDLDEIIKQWIEKNKPITDIPCLERGKVEPDEVPEELREVFSKSFLEKDWF